MATDFRARSRPGHRDGRRGLDARRRDAPTAAPVSDGERRREEIHECFSTTSSSPTRARNLRDGRGGSSRLGATTDGPRVVNRARTDFEGHPIGSTVSAGAQLTWQLRRGRESGGGDARVGLQHNLDRRRRVVTLYRRRVSVLFTILPERPPGTSSSRRRPDGRRVTVPRSQPTREEWRLDANAWRSRHAITASITGRRRERPSARAPAIASARMRCAAFDGRKPQRGRTRQARCPGDDDRAPLTTCWTNAWRAEGARGRWSERCPRALGERRETRRVTAHGVDGTFAGTMRREFGRRLR